MDTQSYLQYQSNDPIKHKCSVVSSLYRHSSNLCSQNNKEEEDKNIERILKNNGYPHALLKKGKNDLEKKISSKNCSVEVLSNSIHRMNT